MNQIKLVFKWLWSKKIYFVLFNVSLLIFLVLIFPLEDLSELITHQVSKNTNNQVYVQFDSMQMNVFNGVGLNIDQLMVETMWTPPLKARSLSVRPHIFSLLMKQPAGEIEADGIFLGKMKVTLGKGTKSESGLARHKLQITADSLSLAELSQTFALPLSMKGKLNVESQAQFDLALQEQPEMDVVIQANRLELPTFNIPTNLGDINIPDLKFQQVQIKGRLSNGNFIFEDTKLGSPQDDLSASIKGSIGLQVKNSPAGLSPQPGSYSLDIELLLKKSLEARAASFVTTLDTALSAFLQNYKSSSDQGTVMKFKVSGSSFQDMPSFSQLK